MANHPPTSKSRWFWSIAVVALWLTGGVIYIQNLWTMASGLRGLNQEIPLNEVKFIAITNRISVSLIYLSVWVAVLVILTSGLLRRFRNTKIGRRFVDRRRWGHALWNPLPVTSVGLLIAIVLVGEYSIDPLWLVPAALGLYFLGVILRVVSRTIPDEGFLPRQPGKPTRVPLHPVLSSEDPPPDDSAGH